MSVEPAAGDIVELRRILAVGSTAYVEQFLRRELAKLIERFPETAAPPTPPKSPAPKVVYEPIASYAFSDSKDTASVVISDIAGLDSAEIQFEPTPTSFTITIRREGLANLKLTVSPLYKKILPDSSKYKVKGKTLTIALDKKKKKTWTKLKKGALDTKKPKPGAPGEEKEKEDPNTALMGLMKKMYDEGDDEMKRTIQKAMWEARNKKADEEEKK
jgi:calcyclin binding protein